MLEFHLILDPAPRAGQYIATCDGELIVTSTQPLLDGARELQARGAPPDSIITTRHRGAADWAMRARLGSAAKLTVVERASGGIPVFARWKEFPANTFVRLDSSAAHLAD